MAEGVFTLTCDEQVTYIKIEARWHKSANRNSETTRGSRFRVCTSIEFYHPIGKTFNNGRNTVSNNHLCGRPLSATTCENVENVAKLLNDDRRYSCVEIAHELDISYRSVHRILTERLQIKRS